MSDAPIDRHETLRLQFKEAMDWGRSYGTRLNLSHITVQDVSGQYADIALAQLDALAKAELKDRLPGNVKPDTALQVFFYEQDFYVLSNFSAFSVVWSVDKYMARRFNTSEEVYHWEKFNHLAGRGVQTLLEQTTSAHEAFKLAQMHKTLQRPDWDDVKVSVMHEILHAKADQHEYVRRKLLATGDRLLVEDSWRDDFWGWGPNRDGKNMLGTLWMRVRDELRAKEAKNA